MTAFVTGNRVARSLNAATSECVVKGFIAVAVLLLTAACAATERIEHRFLNGVVVLKVDPRRVDVAALKRYLVVHPVAYDTDYYLGREPRFCTTDAEYLPCETRDLNAKHFFENAETNQNWSRGKLKELEDLKDFRELDPLVDFFRQSLRFSIWQHERLIAYFRTSRAEELSQDYGMLPVAATTRETVNALNATSDLDRRWKLAYYDWQNSANDLYRSSERRLPEEVWSRFIKTRGIVEHVQYDDPGD